MRTPLVSFSALQFGTYRGGKKTTVELKLDKDESADDRIDRYHENNPTAKVLAVIEEKTDEKSGNQHLVVRVRFP